MTRMPASPVSPPNRFRRLGGVAASWWQVVRGVAGERAYETYVAHHRAHHPDEPVMSERDFWRWYVDRGDTNPTSRCC